MGFLGGAYASGNAAPAVAVLLLRDCGAAALHLSRLVQQAASRAANWAFSRRRAAGGAAANTIALLTRSGGWLAFAVLRVVNMLCILYSLLAERPAAFATPRPEDIQVILPTAPGVSNEGGVLPSWSWRRRFLALGSGLGLVGTVSSRR